MRRGRPGDGIPAWILVAAAFSFPIAGAYAFTGDAPMSFSRSLTDEALLETAVMPAVDAEAYLEEDEGKIDGPFRFAAPHYVYLNVTEEGTLDVLADGSRVWRLRVASEGALSLNFGFTTYDLPGGASLHMYEAGQAGGELLWEGPFSASDRVEREFWSPVIPGEEAVLEVYSPAGSADPRLVVGQVNHDYRGFFGKADDGSLPGSCNIDVICPQADAWRDEIRSAGVYTLNGNWVCSGQMLNSLTSPKDPYFLTASHCGVSTSNDHTMRVYWNKESAVCGNLCCGPVTDNQLGAERVANYTGSDFTLVRLNADPDPDWDVAYAGWDAREDWRPQGCTAIHHPGTTVKTISWNYDPITVTSYLQNAQPGNGTHWRVDDWEVATTEVGSSGSGIWDENRRVVGQLHGGYASCSSITSDWYGRLSKSFVGGGSAATRLKDWLDPENTGVEYLDGSGGGSASVEEAPAALLAGALRSITPNPATGAVRIGFDLARGGSARFDVVDVAGRVVRSLEAGDHGAGSWTVAWDGTGRDGASLPAGVYFVRMGLGERLLGTQKVILVR